MVHSAQQYTHYHGLFLMDQLVLYAEHCKVIILSSRIVAYISEVNFPFLVDPGSGAI